MTSIKCRWTKPYCLYHDGHMHVQHDEFWWCDDNDDCPIGRYCRPKDAPCELLNPRCVYCEYDTGEFEKTVKRYEYADGILTVAGETYLKNEIDYLEIDGRILVKPKESEEEMSDKYKREIEILLSSLPTPKFNPKDYIWVLGSKVIDSLWRECNEYLRVATELKMLCGIEVHEGRDYGDEAIMLLRDVTKIQNAESEAQNNE